MFAQFEALIRDIDRQVEAKQERLVEQRAALADIQSGLDRLQRSFAAEPAETVQARRSPRGPDLPAEAPPGARNGHAEPTPTTTIAAATGEAPRSNGEAVPTGPTCQAPGCDNPVPSTDGQPGPPRRYCSSECRKAAREARVAARAAGEEVAEPAAPFAPVPGASDG